ncbi:MAG: M28 family peptidase [Solirubrobacteraceae bacterium]
MHLPHGTPPKRRLALADRARGFEADIRHLAAMDRPSASVGERAAAEWLAGRLRELGADARVEAERAHGGYWWPIGLLNAAAAAAALGAARARTRTGRRAAAGAAAAAAAAIYDDVSGGPQRFRRLLPQRRTANVVAEIGAPEARRTLLLIAHHDAAHSGLVFHPALPRLAPDRFPELHARSTQTAPIMYLTWLGPVLVAAGALLGRRGALRAGALLALGTVAAMADIGRSPVVPGANDNLSSVAVLLAIAQALRDRPAPGLRVVLLSTGSEESFMEGMRGFARRHFGRLPRETTDVLCLECVGGPTLILLEGEGMLRMRRYPHASREALAAAARRAGVGITRGLRTVAATDALVALLAGYRVAGLASVDHTKFPANYHWPSDTVDNLDWATIGEAIAVTEELVRGLDVAASRVAG